MIVLWVLLTILGQCINLGVGKYYMVLSQRQKHHTFNVFLHPGPCTNPVPGYRQEETVVVQEGFMMIVHRKKEGIYSVYEIRAREIPREQNSSVIQV